MSGEDPMSIGEVMIKQICALMVLGIGCIFHSACATNKVSRTSLENWETRTFGDIGVTLSLPQKSQFAETIGVEKWKKEGVGWRTLRFYWHPQSRGQLMAEPLFRVQFYFHRFDADQYAAFRKGSLSLSYYWIWKDHHSQDYTNSTYFVWKDLGQDVMGWRRDYRAADGDVLVAGVEYMPFGFNDSTVSIDSNAVERVLASIVFSGKR